MTLRSVSGDWSEDWATLWRSAIEERKLTLPFLQRLEVKAILHLFF